MTPPSHRTISNERETYSSIICFVDFTECSEAIRLLGLYWLLCNQTPSRKQMSAATKFLRCLIVEDVDDDAQLMLRQLRTDGHDVTWERVDTPEAMRAALARQPWDVVLSDYRMPRFSGLSALEILRESGLDLPFIIVSGTIGEGIAVAAMKAGVDDYLIKGQLDHLMVAVERELRNAATRRERNVAEVALAETKALLQAALDHSQAGIAIADAPSGKLRYVNRAGLLIGGGTEAELVAGLDVNQYVASWKLFDLDGTPLAKDAVPLARAVLFGEQCTREFLIRRSELDDRIVLANAAPIRNPAGAVTAGIVVFLDITERKRAEELLRQSTKELHARNEELIRINRLMTGRELRLIEMKQQVNNLAAQLGQPRPHALAFMDAAAAEVLRTMPKTGEPESGTAPVGPLTIERMKG